MRGATVDRLGPGLAAAVILTLMPVDLADSTTVIEALVPELCTCRGGDSGVHLVTLP